MRLLLTLTLFLLHGIVFAQGYTWTIYNTSNSNIPSDFVWSVVLDPQKGGVWGSTYGGGAFRFDGNATWAVYNTSNSGIGSNEHTQIRATPQGVWVGLDNSGLSFFDGVSWTTYTSANSMLPDNYLRSLYLESNGDVWAGTKYGGLAKLSGGNWTIYNTSNSGIGHNTIYGINRDMAGDLWVSTGGNGISRLDAGGNWQVYNPGNSNFVDDNCYHITMNGSDMWVGTQSYGAMHYNSGTWTNFPSTASTIPHPYVRHVLVDYQNNVWFATGGGGIAKYDGQTWTIFNTLNSPLPHNNCYYLMEDYAANIWVATFGGGLVKIGTNSVGSAEAAVAEASLYPNPSDGYSKLTLDGCTHDLYDATGKVIVVGGTGNELAYPGLAEGVYFVRVRKDDGLDQVIRWNVRH